MLVVKRSSLLSAYLKCMRLMYTKPSNNQSAIEHDKEMEATSQIELENTLFVQFSYIMGTLCTFAIAIHIAMFAPPFVSTFIKHTLPVKCIFSCFPELEVHVLNNQHLW